MLYEPEAQTVTLWFNYRKGCFVQVRRFGLSLSFLVKLPALVKVNVV